jgi:hypothetical protein
MLVSFTDAELDILMSLSACIDPTLRDAFVRDVTSALAQVPEQARGPGLVHRTASKLQRRYATSVPPPRSSAHTKYG